MEIVIAAVVVALGLAAGLVIAALLLAKRVPGFAAHGPTATPEQKPAAKRRTREAKQAAAPAAETGAHDRAPSSPVRDATLENRLMELEQQRGDHQTGREPQGHDDRCDHDFHFRSSPPPRPLREPQA